MELGLKGKVALVGGASLGMGRAIALQLAREGAKVAIVARDQERLKAAEEAINRVAQTPVLAISLDLAKTAQIPAMVQEVKASFGGIDVLVNNAGGPPPGTLSDVSDEDWELALTQNLKSVIVLVREVIPMMKEKRFGRILTIASQVVKEPPPSMILSNTARAGVIAFTKSISHELAPYGITVNNLCPGPILTDRMRYLIQQRAQKESCPVEAIEEQIREAVPMKRIGTPEEFADLAVFLASERAGYVTGTTIAVDGGITKSLM